MFGIKRYKQVINSVRNTDEYKDSYKRNAIGIPYSIQAIDSAFADWLDMNDKDLKQDAEHLSEDFKRRMRAEYQRFKMKKLLVLEFRPNINGYTDKEIDKEYLKIAKSTECLMNTPIDKRKGKKKSKKKDDSNDYYDYGE